LSLPQEAAPSGGDPQTQLNRWLSESLSVAESDVANIDIPSFKIGTLDNLVNQSEELTKLDGQFQQIFTKSGDLIDSLYQGNKAQISAAKRIDSNYVAEKYLALFTWNSNKFRIDKSIPDLIDLISKETFQLDSDVRTSFNNYSAAKTNLTAVDRRQTGNLSVRSLHDVVRREHFVLDSEYLQTVLIAVPLQQKADFLNIYETLTQLVVPRSASIIAQDSEYILFNVTLFRKVASEFVAKSRDHKWTPRDFKYSDSLIEDMRKEQQNASQTERKLYGEIVRLSRTAYSDIYKNWIHLRVIRIYVESVLRYGLPPNFLTAIINADPAKGAKSVDKCEATLIEKFGYLGGAAFSKDKRGKLKGDSDLHEYGALVDNEYKPFVLFYMEV
jgi:V-type H+-transporting ATPase subunit C